MFGLVSVSYSMWYAFGLLKNVSGLWRHVVYKESINFSKEHSTTMLLLNYNKRGVFFRNADTTKHTWWNVTSGNRNLISCPPWKYLILYESKQCSQLFFKKTCYFSQVNILILPLIWYMIWLYIWYMTRYDVIYDMIYMMWYICDIYDMMWYDICDMLYVIWYVIYDMWYDMWCDMWYNAICDMMLYDVMWYEICDMMWYEICDVIYEICDIIYVMWYMWYMICDVICDMIYVIYDMWYDIYVI